jgi:hypothetical protein
VRRATAGVSARRAQLEVTAAGVSTDEIHTSRQPPIREPAGVGVCDPVGLYLREIGRVSLLTAEKEASLARRIERHDVAVKRQLVEANLCLDVTIAKRCMRRGQWRCAGDPGPDAPLRLDDGTAPEALQRGRPAGSDEVGRGGVGRLGRCVAGRMTSALGGRMSGHVRYARKRRLEPVRWVLSKQGANTEPRIMQKSLEGGSPKGHWSRSPSNGA